MGLSWDDVSETTWKWRYKAKTLGRSKEKTISDFESSSPSSSLTDLKGEVDIKKPSDQKHGGLGSHPSVKTFYEGPNSSERMINWVDYPPRQISKSAAKAQDRVSINLYQTKDLDKPVISGRFALKYHMIEIQNLELVAALKPLVEKQGLHLDANEIAKFESPFRPLYFAYDDIVSMSKEAAAGAGLRPHVLLLIKVLDEVFVELRSKKKNLQSSMLVNFNIAWTYFARDSAVISSGYNCEYMSKVVDTVLKTTPMGKVLVIKAQSLKFNGEAFVWEDECLEIPSFKGNKPIKELPHYPVQFHEAPQALEAKMGARGRKVLDYQGLSYCEYNGVAIFHQDKKIEKHNINERILVDVVGYNKHHLAKGVREGTDAKTQTNIVDGTGRQNVDISVEMPIFSSCIPLESRRHAIIETTENASNDAAGNSGTSSTSGKRLTEDEQERNTKAMLARPDDLKYISPLLEGYALKNKIWVSFYVEDIRPITWNHTAFDHLVYDEQQKDLVLSFVESHGHSDTNAFMDDVIVGKGCGLIILLSGPPGTGKTLTAEAVADRTRRPLFYLQAEDLGISAATLGENIKKVFEMATEWDAVILLDEADVFMAERHPQDIARNELVSIFLREIEYFKGILFLTTNLYQTIDSAFRSRVSLHLLFKPLGPDARAVVWRKFLDRLQPSKQSNRITELEDDDDDGAEDTGGTDKGKSVEKVRAPEISDEDIKELAHWQLNGREIKNAVKMVKSWCDHKGYEMTLTRLENGIKVTSPHATRLNAGGTTDLYDD
ncbi:hypothetical protein BX600DRAFT_467761 [Xylariales sp. PMI_506]|nr:hypothetical protein BX600DRAFT_467761 [Xylariales sp. PMI_506]